MQMSTWPLKNKFKVFMEWIRYYVCFCRPAAVTTGLACAHWIVRFAVVDVLMTYFRVFWSFADAVGLVNMLDGLSSILEVLMIYISENHVRPFKVILWSSGAYIVGLIMLCISIYIWIPEDKAWMYFIPVVFLLAVGESGGLPILKEFLGDELKAHEPIQNIDEDRVKARKKVWWLTSQFLCGVLTCFICGYLSTASTFISSASLMGIGSLLFLCCIPLFHSVEKFSGRSDNEAAAREISHMSPSGNERLVAGEIRIDMPSCVSPTKKPISTVIPMWIAFLVFGLVLSTGDTFFLEQAYHMGSKESVYLLLLLSNMISCLAKWIPKTHGTKTKGILVEIWIAMALSVLCGGVAWCVESRRLNGIIAKYGSCDHRDDGAHMSILWLGPQFFLLALMEAIGKRGLDHFVEMQLTDGRMKKYAKALNEGVIGFGGFISGFLVKVLQSWFTDYFNCTRLDKYYILLMIVSFVNLCYYCGVWIYYAKKK